jgi:hypothetical protein
MPQVIGVTKAIIAVLACVRYIFRDETLTGQELVVPHPLEKGYIALPRQVRTFLQFPLAC